MEGRKKNRRNVDAVVACAVPDKEKENDTSVAGTVADEEEEDIVVAVAGEEEDATAAWWATMGRPRRQDNQLK